MPLFDDPLSGLGAIGASGGADLNTGVATAVLPLTGEAGIIRFMASSGRVLTMKENVAQE